VKLNHLDLQVLDVQRSVLFFERFFGLELTSSRASPALAFLTDGHGFVLVLQRMRAPAPYPDGFHLGFLVDDVETVRAFHAQAKAGGLDVTDVETNARGTMVYCRTPEGFAVEVSCRVKGPAARP
jgi:catechol 2,3-dioxygenase-like lactoylglutathione lyase family enzyme